MSILKWAMVGAAAAYGINYITKKRVEDGKSIVDDWNEKAPELMEKAKTYTQQVVDKISDKVQNQQASY